MQNAALSLTFTAPRAQVSYGTQSGKYTQTAAASSTTYTRADMCGPPANDTGFRDPG